MRRMLAVVLVTGIVWGGVTGGASAQVGGFISRPVFSEDGLAGAVFAGSTIDLESAAAGVGASGVWAQGPDGAFVLLVVGGPPFVNEAFRARFPGGFPTPAAVTLTRAAGASLPPAPAAVAPAPTRAVGSWVVAQPPPGASPATGEWIAIAAPEGRTIMARVIRPSGTGPFPAVVLLHSQTGFSNAHLGLGEEIARAGFVTVVGCWFAGHYDGSTTADPPPPLPLADGIDCPDGPPLRPMASTRPLDDINAMITATKALPGVRTDRVALVGNSRGSIAAVVAGAALGTALQGVVAIGGVPPGAALLAPTFAAPLLILQGEQDSVVPTVNATMLEQAMRALGRPVESHFYPAGHGILFDTPFSADVVSRTVAFLRARLQA